MQLHVCLRSSFLLIRPKRTKDGRGRLLSSKVNSLNPLLANFCLNAIYKNIMLQGFYYIGG